MKMVITAVSMVFFSLLALPNDKIDRLKARLEDDLSDTSLVRLLNQIGYEYWIVNPVESIVYGQKARNLAEHIHDTLGLAFSYRVIGVAHWARGSYDEALTNLYEGLLHYQAIMDSLGVANCMMNIGLVYEEQNDHKRALDQYVSALVLFRLLEKESRIGTTYNKMATVFLRLGNLPEADKYLKEALNIHQSHGFEYGIAETCNRLGLLYKAWQQYDSAILFFNKSLSIGARIDDKDGLAKNSVDLAGTYLAIGQDKKAEEILLEGIRTARAIGSNKWLKSIFEELKELYKSRGEYETAVYYYDQYIRLSDSIFNEEIARNISNFETQLATMDKERLINEKEQEILFLEQEARLDLLYRVSAIALSVLLGLVGYLAYSRQRMKHQQARKKADELDRELEMKNRELASYTVNFVQKNQLFEELREIIASIKTNQNIDPYLKKRFKDLDRVVNNRMQVDRDWEDFKLRFQNIHQHFFDQLLEKTPSLTNYELRLAALVRLNFSMKEIGNILGISAESVKTARYRLKKKLALPGQVKLNDFLNELD